MESLRQDFNVASRLGYEWNPEFSTPQTVSRRGQNTPFWATNKDDGTEIPPDTKDLLSQFLGEIFDDTGPFLYQAVPIREFCGPSANVSTLAAGTQTNIQQHMVLLDERNDDGSRTDARGTCRRRMHDGVLSASSLYKLLRKPRYAIESRPAGGVTATSTTNVQTSSHGNAHEEDVDRRLIYVTNLDKWCMLAIICTATRLQSGFLRDFIYRHIEFKTHVGVQVPTTGFQSFALEFHLPFYACKRGPELVKDCRFKMNNKPLRRTGDLQFLKLAPFPTDASVSDDCIYEAQISVLVTSMDHWSWTAYAFVDTYYKGDENDESVGHYIDQVQNGAKLDPLARGQYDAEPPVWKPREYFLRVLESRVKQVKQEWHNTVFCILQRIEPHTHDDLLSEPVNQGLAGDVLNKDTQIFFDKTIRLLQQMSYQLSLTVDAWTRFMNIELAYFTNLESLPGKKRTPVMLISEINKEVEDLLVLRKNLDHQRDLLHGLLQKLEKGLQLDNNTIATLQKDNAVLITALTVSASFLGVISTTAAIFSIESVVAGPGAVAGVVVALLGGLLIIFAIFLKWPWYRTIVDLLARIAPYWIEIQRSVRVMMKPSGRPTQGGASPSGIVMEQLANSTTTAPV